MQPMWLTAAFALEPVLLLRVQVPGQSRSHLSPQAGGLGEASGAPRELIGLTAEQSSRWTPDRLALTAQPPLLARDGAVSLSRLPWTPQNPQGPLAGMQGTLPPAGSPSHPARPSCCQHLPQSALSWAG